MSLLTRADAAARFLAAKRCRQAPSGSRPPDRPPEGAEYVGVHQQHPDRPGELVPDDPFQNAVRGILYDVAEEGPEVVGLAVAPVSAAVLKRGARWSLR